MTSNSRVFQESSSIMMNSSVKKSHSADAIVVGAGVIGLMITKQLVESGLSVITIDKQRAGQEASLAGGGILSTLTPWQPNTAMNQLIHLSQQLYPSLCQALHETTGIDPEYEPSGLLIIDEPLSPDQRNTLTDLHPTQHLSSKQCQQLLPGILVRQQGHLIPNIAHIRNPKLVTSLRQWALKADRVSLIEHQAITSITVNGGRITGVNTQHHRLSSSCTILAAGAWSHQIAARLSTTHLPVKPIKGQMVRIKLKRPLTMPILLHKGTYLIPRRNQTVLIGSTLEDCGFDKSTSRSAVSALRKHAEQLLPELASATELDHWAGLRPGTPRNAPIIDCWPGLQQGYICTGHFRYGLSSAPASALLIKSLVTGEDNPTGLNCEDFRLRVDSEGQRFNNEVTQVCEAT